MLGFQPMAMSMCQSQIGGIFFFFLIFLLRPKTQSFEFSLIGLLQAINVIRCLFVVKMLKSNPIYIQ